MQIENRSPAKVLIIDEDSDICEIFSMGLSPYFHCAQGTSITELTKLYEQMDALVVDLQLKGMDLSALPRMPTVLTSRDPFQNSEGFPVLNKPFEVRDLIHHVNRVLPESLRINGFYVGCRVESHFTPEFGLGTIAEFCGNDAYVVVFDHPAPGLPLQAKCHQDALRAVFDR